jgi:hypothetical protein
MVAQFSPAVASVDASGSCPKGVEIHYARHTQA